MSSKKEILEHVRLLAKIIRRKATVTDIARCKQLDEAHGVEYTKEAQALTVESKS